MPSMIAAMPSALWPPGGQCPAPQNRRRGQPLCEAVLSGEGPGHLRDLADALGITAELVDASQEDVERDHAGDIGGLPGQVESGRGPVQRLVGMAEGPEDAGEVPQAREADILLLGGKIVRMPALAVRE